MMLKEVPVLIHNFHSLTVGAFIIKAKYCYKYILEERLDS